MKFTDIFIRRPVLATVLSLFILVLGLRSIGMLPILQFPRTENAVVTVATAYTGANANLVAGFITTPLENSIAQANGIDYMTSTSTQGLSVISVNLRLNADTDKALTEINTKVNAVRNQLPPESQQPVLSVKVGRTIDAMYIGFNSKVLTLEQDHRLPDPRGAAETAGDSRGADGGDYRQKALRHPRLAQPEEARGL